MDLVVITIPWCMVDKAPATDAGQPGPDGATSLVALVLTDESAEESVRCWHMSLFIDVPAVAELGEAEEAGSICGLGVWHECTKDGHCSRFNKWHGERLSK